jgi:predicted RNase H-like HicB family nuclease
MNVQIMVHEAEEGGFWAEVPAMPGCFSQGETMDQLLASMREAIQSWLDTLHRNILRGVDSKIKNRPIRIPRSTWYLKAVLQKLERQGHDGKETDASQ